MFNLIALDKNNRKFTNCVSLQANFKGDEGLKMDKT